MRALHAINMPHGKMQTIQTSKPKVSHIIYKCTESIVQNVNSNIRWHGESAEYIIQEFRSKKNGFSYWISVVAACTSHVRNANMNFATAATSHSKWAQNVACPNIVPNWGYIHIIREIVSFIWEIKSLKSYKNCSRYIFCPLLLFVFTSYIFDFYFWIDDTTCRWTKSSTILSRWSVFETKIMERPVHVREQENCARCQYKKKHRRDSSTLFVMVTLMTIVQVFAGNKSVRFFSYRFEYNSNIHRTKNFINWFIGMRLYRIPFLEITSLSIYVF